LQAIQAEVLCPGKRPVNYGQQTHAELCRWVGTDPTALPSRKLTKGPHSVSLDTAGTPLGASPSHDS
jgi:hypothetical protein